MRKAFLILLLLAGTLTFAQEQPRLSPAAEKSGENSRAWDTPENTEDNILHVMAEENTAYVMKRYGIVGDQKRQQIYQAYRNYLLAEHRENLKGTKSRGNTKNGDMSSPLQQLQTKLKAITGMEVDPSLPR